MKNISSPIHPIYTPLSENKGSFEILECYPGYGATIGNALRRVLLSSLEGAAVTAVKIKGISHEFATINGVMEDAVQIILNLKKVRFKLFSDEPIKLTLKFKGEGKVTAKDIKTTSKVEVVNTDQLIATVTDKKAEIEMVLEISKGLGYVPVEQQEREGKEIGMIAVDAIFTPMRRVNYIVENMRVGKRTDYDKVTVDIETDGTITPEEAFMKSVEILINQFKSLQELGKLEKVSKKSEEKKDAAAEIEEPAPQIADPMEKLVTDLKPLSTRTLNVLQANNIHKVGDIASYSENEILDLEGMGGKGVREIKKAIGEFGLTLKAQI
jgi:DNA-directed RNA polymerase subunit alpha